MEDDRFWALWKKTSFANGVLRIIIDEAHCVYGWGSTFRASYLKLSHLVQLLRHQNPNVQWYLTLATLNLSMIQETLDALQLPQLTFPLSNSTVCWEQRSTNRSNLYYAVQIMKHSKESCQDLAFLVPEGLLETDPHPKRFLVYCNTRNDTVRAARFLHARASESMRKSVKWVHAGMSDEHCQGAVKDFAAGKVLGIIATDAIGMVNQTITLYFCF